MCQFACVYFTCGHRRYIFQDFCEPFLASGKRCASSPDDVKKSDITQKVYKTYHCGACIPRLAFIDNASRI